MSHISALLYFISLHYVLSAQSLRLATHQRQYSHLVACQQARGCQGASAQASFGKGDPTGERASARAGSSPRPRAHPEEGHQSQEPRGRGRCGLQAQPQRALQILHPGTVPSACTNFSSLLHPNGYRCQPSKSHVSIPVTSHKGACLSFPPGMPCHHHCQTLSTGSTYLFHLLLSASPTA